MKIYFHIALLSAQLLMCGGICQPAMAQPSDRLAAEPSVALNSEQVVNRLVQRNLQRAQANFNAFSA